jgi:thermolysin
MNLRALWCGVVAALFLSGCKSDPMSGDPQADALANLESETGVPWTVRYHPDIHTPAFLDGKTAPMVARASDAAGAARGFFANHATLFRLGSIDELDHDRTDTDELGMAHARFVQKQGGIAVYGGELTAHFGSDGALLRVHGRYLPLPAIDPTPIITVDDATTAAIGSALAARPAADPKWVSSETPSLVIDPGPVPRNVDLPPRLAWHVEVAVADPAAPARLGVFVDAKSGQPYRVEKLLDDVAGSGEGVFGDQQPLEIVADKTRFTLENDSAGKQKTYSANWSGTLPGHVVTSTRPDRWDEEDPGRGAAVDAHAYVTATYHYYATAHGRSGWDGAGHGVRAVVHYGQDFDNAFWDGKELVFGDGDGATFAPLSGALDVVAHEYTHAVTQSSARLGHSDDSGALNEGVSDIFACFVELATRGSRGNWKVGEDVYRPGHKTALRDMSDPHKTNNPAHVSEEYLGPDDDGGIHTNSTIPSHAAYLMSQGGTNSVSREKVTAIGATAAQKIWYRALTRYLHASAGFRDAADATLAAARDLYGDGAKRDSVEQAWRAVGVIE